MKPRTSLLAVATFLLMGVMRSVNAQPFDIGDWQNVTFGDHPLVGKIWSAEENSFIDEQELLDRMLSVPVVLLGEKHDNADHHRLQAQIVNLLVEKEKKPALVFEMLTDDQADAEDAVHNSEVSWSALDKKLSWSDRGWPEWDSYRLILEVARESTLAVRPGNARRSDARSISQGGLDSLKGDERDRLALMKPLPAAVRKELDRELLDSHCGFLPESALPTMSAVQMYRDARMADGVLQATALGRPVVLIAGAGHVRADRAVPYFLEQRVPGLKSVVIAIREVDSAEMEADAYTKTTDHEGPPLFDYVIFTPRVDDIDPCEKFKDHFKNSAS